MQKIQYIAEKMLNKALSKIRASRGESRLTLNISIRILDESDCELIRIQTLAETSSYSLQGTTDRINKAIEYMQITKENKKYKVSTEIKVLENGGAPCVIVGSDPR